MLSSRIPPVAETNAWSRRLAVRRAAGARLVDLTETNPTRAGFARDPAELAALADPAALSYDPEPLGLASARAAVAGTHAERGSGVDPADICLTASTSEAYAHLFRLLCSPGDQVLAPRPSYPLFEPLAAAEGVRFASYRLAWDGAWHLDLDSLERAADPGTRAVIVVQPNHPTGSCLDPAELAALERWCERRRVALISDEVFTDYPRAAEARALPSLLGDRAVPTFVLGGLSKGCGLPQMKVGWIAIAGPPAARQEARQGLEWLGDLFLSVSTPAQRALPHWLANRRAFQSQVRERIAANLATLERVVSSGAELAVLPAAGGWAGILRVPTRRTDEAWALELLERDVIVHPGHFYDFETEGHLVVSLIVPPEHFRDGIGRIAELLRDRG